MVGGINMSLIKCPECGKDFSDRAAACPNCGCPTNEIVSHEENVKGISCPKCKSHDVLIERIAEGEKSKETAQVQKKSIATRAINKMGRGTMIAMTGGLWALTPKKSAYKEVSKGKTKIKYKKVATCQNCGKSWTLWFN
jgi:NMD protein affecting ribosome stability and mRNA decay